MATHTQTIRFEVRFADLRKADLPDLYKKLWGAMSDVTVGANRLISAAWMVKLGAVSLPVEAPRRPKEGQALDPKPWPLSSALYRGMSGEWRPLGDQPMYAAKRGPEVGGGVLSATAARVETRIKEDWIAVARGEQSLPTFKHLPLLFRAQEVTLTSGNRVKLHVFAGRKGGWVTVQPRKLDKSLNAILQKCQDGTFKAGSAGLVWDKPEGRRGRWFVSIAYTETRADVEVATVLQATAEEDAPLIAGVDIGIQHAAWIAYCSPTGEPEKKPTIIQFPNRTLRAVAQITNERKQRSLFNRADIGLREGRGRNRKLRATAKIEDRVSRINETMIEQIVAASVSAMKLRGVKVVAIEDHSDWSVDNMNQRADRAATRSEAAKIRTEYFRWHQGEFRAKFEHACAREGLLCYPVAAQWTSRTCHKCGLIWKTHGLHVKADAPAADRATGRYDLRHFRCSETATHPDGKKGCGYEGQADHNAAINIARLGLRAHNGEVEPEIAPVRGRRKKLGVVSLPASAVLAK